MKKQIVVSAVVLAMTAGLTGCFSTTRTVARQRALAPDAYKTASISELQTLVSERDEALKTLYAQVLITATTGGAKEGKETEYTSFRGYIFVQKPEMLRVIMQLPLLGSRALDMVSDGKTFTLVHATAGHGDVWRQGSNVVTTPSKNGLENLRPGVFLDSLLIPGVKAGEFVTLTESTRVIAEETRRHDAVEEPDYDVTVLKPVAGNVMMRERTIHINRSTLLPFEQDLYDTAGRVVTVATYENYQPAAVAGGKMQPMPMLVTIKRPLEEYSLKIEVTKLTLNEVFDADQFELKAPAGAAIQTMP